MGCLYFLCKVRYFHHSLVTEEDSKNADKGNSGLKQRKTNNKGDLTDEGHGGEEPEKLTRSGDPIKWFGVLSPPALRQSQVTNSTSNI